MKKFNLIIILFFLYACGGFGDAAKVLRNEKINTTDEFFVKKKEPLVLPPDYNKLPSPGSLKKSKKNEEEKIKTILKAPSKQDHNSGSSSIEKSIIDKIRK